MFQMHNAVGALLTMDQAREVQKKRNSISSAKADLDLLYMAILHNNYGYLKVNVKQYDEARACFEEALLVSRCGFVAIYKRCFNHPQHLRFDCYRSNNPFWEMLTTTELFMTVAAIWSSQMLSILRANSLSCDQCQPMKMSIPVG
jgi:hypothetical protein